MFDLTKQVISSFAKGAKEGIVNTAKSAVDYFKSNLNDLQTGKATAPEITKKMSSDFSEGATKVAITLARETAAGASSLLKGAVEAVTPNATPEQRQKYRTGTAPLEEKVFGRVTKPPQQVYEEISGFVKDKEGSQIEKAFLPIAGVLGYVFMESPIGLGTKTAKIPLDSMEFIAKSKNKNVIRELIKENVPGVSSRTLNRVSQDLIEKNTVEEVMDYFGGKSKIVADIETPDFSSPANKLQEESVKQRLLQTSDNTTSPQIGPLDTLTDSIAKDPDVSSVKNILEEGSLEDAATFSGTKNKLSEFGTKTREVFQDSWIRIKQLQNKQGLDDMAEGSPYAQYILTSGRVEGRNRELAEFMESMANDYARISDEYSVPTMQLRDDINGYLWYKHAPERNAKLGDGAAGILDADASKALKELEAKPYFKEIEAKAKLIQDLGKQKLDVLENAGIISKQSRADLEKLYPNYVSFQRIMTDDDLTGSFTRGFDVKSSTIKKAKGSQLPIEDIVANQVYNLSRAYVAAEKNIVMKSLVEFEKKYKPDMLKVVSRKPLLNKDGSVVTKDGIPVMQEPNLKRFQGDEGGVPFFEDGKQKFVEFKDQGIGDIVAGLSYNKWPGILHFIPVVTRLYSQLQTRLSPSFLAPNKIRDLQEALVYFSSTNGGKYRLASALKKDKESIATVFSYLRKKDLNAPLQKEYDEFLKSGATTGGLSAMTKGDIKLDWDAALKIRNSKPRLAAKKLIDTIDFWGEVAENSTRFTVYRLAKEAGRSVQEAAFIAKEASVNFNKMGTAGPIVNGAYMFANAAIQGNTKTLKALKNPKTATKLITAIGASVLAVNQYNNTMDPDWKQKVNQWDRVRGLNFVIPTKDGSFEYFTIPIGYGLIPIKSMMDSVDDIWTGDLNIKQALGNITTSIIESYNPVGGTDFLQAITPTIAEVIPLYDLKSNKAWHGGMIKPDYDPYAPNSVKYFKDLKDTATGRGAILATQAMSKIGLEISPADLVYVYENLIGGAGRDVSNLFDSLVGAVKGDFDVNKTPIIRRFYRSKSEERVQTATDFYDKIHKSLEEQSREKFYIKQEAEGVVDHMSVLKTNEERINYLSQIQEKKPEVLDKVKDIITDKSAGLTYTQRKIKELNVENGARAKFIYDEVLKGEDLKTQKQILQEYVAKGIVTEEVFAQLLQIKKAN